MFLNEKQALEGFVEWKESMEIVRKHGLRKGLIVLAQMLSSGVNEDLAVRMASVDTWNPPALDEASIRTWITTRLLFVYRCVENDMVRPNERHIVEASMKAFDSMSKNLKEAN